MWIHCQHSLPCLVLIALVTNLPALADDPLQEAIQDLEQANELLQQKAYAEASKKAQTVAGRAGISTALLQRAAEVIYRSGFSKESLVVFDRVVELSPASAPRNWQRGIALCSCGEWKKGAAQFKTHHDVNPDDVENSAWYFLCVAKSKGIEAARETVIPSRRDGRQPMMSVLKMLQGTIEPDEVIAAAVANTNAGSMRKRAQFYADLYVGLYFDSLDQPKNAVKYLRRSLTHGIDGYMADTARVYLSDRFPGAADAK